MRRSWSALSIIGVFAFAQTASAEMTPRDIYKTYGKAVVLVFATDGSAQGSAGTGSIITKDGEIITNAHVVSKKGRTYKRIFVYLKPERLTGSMKDDLKERLEVSLIDINHDLDLALLKMKRPPAGLTVLPVGSPDAVDIGEPVVAIGHPETAGLWTMTKGMISSVVKDFQGVQGKDIFQTDASINRGNSGGPLINSHGQLVGVNTSISRRAQDGLAITGINFSLKSSVPMKWLQGRDLLALNYAPTPAPGAGTAVASAKPPPAEPKAYTIKGDTGEAIAVVEPETKEEVADVSWGQPGETQTVSGKRRVPKSKRRKAQIITKRRPYKMDPFVAERVREIKAMEHMMDDMRGRIDKKLGKKSRRNSAFDELD